MCFGRSGAFGTCPVMCFRRRELRRCLTFFRAAVRSTSGSIIKFRELDVRALRRSVINQRRDLHSTNSYSILPALSRIGVLDNGDAALFHRRPIHSPVFAFGAPGSGLSSLAMALSMLGYRCCSDFDSIPECEFESLLAGRTDRVFDAYVNIGSLETQIRVLIQRYPSAKYIVMDDVDKSADRNNHAILTALEGADASASASRAHKYLA